MNQKQALARLKTLIGPKLAWRINERALSAIGRQNAGVLAKQLRAQQAAAKEKLDARREELLQDPEYVRLRTEWQTVKDAADRQFGLSHAEPISVGRMGELFFTVVASGDNWEEIVAKLEAQRAKERAS